MTFVFQKKYQGIAGTSVKAGLAYNALLGLGAVIVYLFINKFRIEVSLYSVAMAALYTTVIMLYVMISFKTMEKGNISLYTLFLMSGGMAVPYIWGVIFLNEELSVARTLGLVLILSAIIISNTGGKKPEKSQLLLCIAVFILNGVTSVTSKTHQINPVSQYVTSADFAFLVALFRVIICVIIFVFKKDILADKETILPVKTILPIAFAATLADGISFMLQLTGAKDLPATVLYPLVTGGSVILSTLAGMLVFKERIYARQWIGVGICFAGTLLFL